MDSHKRFIKVSCFDGRLYLFPADRIVAIKERRPEGSCVFLLDDYEYEVRESILAIHNMLNNYGRFPS